MSRMVLHPNQLDEKCNEASAKQNEIEDLKYRNQQLQIEMNSIKYRVVSRLYAKFLHVPVYIIHILHTMGMYEVLRTSPHT